MLFEDELSLPADDDLSLFDDLWDWELPAVFESDESASMVEPLAHRDGLPHIERHERSSVPSKRRLTALAEDAGYRLLSVSGEALRLMCGRHHRFEVMYEALAGKTEWPLCTVCSIIGTPPQTSFKKVDAVIWRPMVGARPPDITPTVVPESQSRQLAVFCKATSLRYPADYINRSTPCTWVCIANHTFRTTKSTLDSRLRRYPDKACPFCHINRQAQHGTVCLSYPKGELTYVSICRWRCGCGELFNRCLREVRIVCGRCEA